MEITLALIKPDAVAAGCAEEIMQCMAVSGLTIIASRQLQLTPSKAEEFYVEHRSKPLYSKLVQFMSSGPIWAVALVAPDAITRWRKCMGPTNTLEARESEPKSIRALYGTDGTLNAAHGSDSITSAAREVKFFFPDMVLEPLLGGEAAAAFIHARLQPALVEALTALAKQKPTSTPADAVSFLGRWLLQHNPKRPAATHPGALDS